MSLYFAALHAIIQCTNSRFYIPRWVNQKLISWQRPLNITVIMNFAPRRRVLAISIDLAHREPYSLVFGSVACEQIKQHAQLV